MTSTGPIYDTRCPLCGRPLGIKQEKHHIVPRSLGGRETVILHPICHRKIHSLFSERELRARYNTIAALREHPEITRFTSWLKGKDPDFYKRTESIKR